METIGDIRWKQRFQNFEKAFTLLRELEKTGIDDLRPLEQEGFIQRFEYTFELAWKTAKDYLEYSGHVITQASPRPVIKEAFAAGVIADGQAFINMAEARNLLSHTYDAARFKEILIRIKSEYLPALVRFYDFLKEQG